MTILKPKKFIYSTYIKLTQETEIEITVCGMTKKQRSYGGVTRVYAAFDIPRLTYWKYLILNKFTNKPMLELKY